MQFIDYLKHLCLIQNTHARKTVSGQVNNLNFRFCENDELITRRGISYGNDELITQTAS